jgi:hypothetical protein
MRVTNWGIWVLAAVIIAILVVCGQLVAETNLYNSYVTRLEQGAEKISVGTPADLEKIIGVPPDGFLFDEQTGTVTWSWDAREHAGELHEALGLVTTKGHFTLSVIFQADGTVEKIYSGVN